MKSKFFLMITIPALLIFFVNSLHAQQANKGLQITPSNFEFTINPGQSVTQEITLKNLTPNKENFSLTTRNFTAQGEQGGVNLTQEDTGYSLEKWIKISKTQATIRSGQQQTFSFTISVPKNAEPGGHFGSIVFSTIPPPELRKTGAVVSQEVASLLLVKVPGDIKEDAVISSFKTTKSFYEEGPVDFETRVENRSNVHIKPIGVISIKNELTGEKSFIGIDERNILPQAIRIIPARWDKKFLIGKFIAYANLSYGDKSTPLVQQSTEFYAFPLRYLAILAIGLLLLFLMRKRISKAFRAFFT